MTKLWPWNCFHRSFWLSRIIFFSNVWYIEKVFIIFNLFFQNLDLTKHRLIYDGPLTLKLGDTKRFKTIELHVVLLEDCIMLLQKQDDKYLLKFHTSTVGNAAVGSQGHKFCHSPVIKFSAMLVRPVATGKLSEAKPSKRIWSETKLMNKSGLENCLRFARNHYKLEFSSIFLMSYNVTLTTWIQIP